ncbi:NAD(P) transhydrogenase subunit alpha [Synechococcus elongatus]|uniref:proton-translocating NAD(P)(+) transhydrogenase n=3 Tax=Synechococcus elongatus TaxID=32046 RepID=Q31MS7_SYNE7|nr:NAD(P) transhydrogenase subunit alpha [Synechococcus elongatus]BAD78259.1 pyridine nucleotide transhydrogenase alpha subunit [Synechococcus elongatus PCC 6301]ABB57642.1 pyridine nucleotide transhydrogenase alpha subunit [Synechococcus elongatus PCC 7942 = FACHB-805]MBD2588450.1 NAD(P) transhydrogenase subunit alpha [Synechococcus elongatus FACHB-242]MBD2689387.1 NAD(P) transhydrogenase subunit alpha [Synechococcus elongatus FACHB-1061]MBD2708194.1 NAD(P) transhydrogenase subunit alpha [Syn
MRSPVNCPAEGCFDNAAGSRQQTVMKILIPCEPGLQERRVAMLPSQLARLKQLTGGTISVQSGAGQPLGLSDRDYQEAGAEVSDQEEQLWRQADLVLSIGPWRSEQATPLNWLRSGACLIGLLDPWSQTDSLDRLAAQGVSALSLELIPRISRAQAMDVLSSQASIIGYRSVLLGATALGRYLPMLTTAAGTIPPAKVLVLGAGVAGLQAIATARRLGAVVSAFDVRKTAGEEVQSLGAKFIDVDLSESAEASGGYAKQLNEDSMARLRAGLLPHLQQADLIVTTAQVPGKPAPCLISAEMVAQLQPGTVIVDAAAERGGNCELTCAGREVDIDGVKVLGPTAIAAGLPHDASFLFGRNLLALLPLLCHEGELRLPLDDEIIAGCCVVTAGERRFPPQPKPLPVPEAV